ncbi:uncharacterized protein ATNIH1004_002347 [Aspergillus tanneri]|uniref:Uncharacterized protein n=1 Tax=Aspergillus tanneri TaxID=1220188 RepID=A0A5M9MUQ9_9EURO|nr:uncharacterized protein ATNIH1004_002347 [Aspergillus tanneri]KAA8649676.1 hypothetical protein ATNIH1004_002347 [Aspergillus tanneri]
METARALVAELVLAVAYTRAQGFVNGGMSVQWEPIMWQSFDRLSVEKLYDKFGEPDTEPVMRLDGQPLPVDLPLHGTVPVWLGKKANKVELSEAHLLLSDSGEAFSHTEPQAEVTWGSMQGTSFCLTR